MPSLDVQAGDPGRVHAHFESLEPRLLFSAVPLITEFIASNDAGLLDEDGDSSDWLELHNAGDTALSLDGWFLTDDLSNLTRWALPDVMLDPGAYLLVFASGKDRPDTDGTELHTSFALRAAGEYLALVQPDGVTVAHDFGLSYPTQLEDISFGLGGSVGLTAASPAGFLTAVTPGILNPDGLLAPAADTAFSVDRGFYDLPIDVEITSATPGAAIYYTLDGSTPIEGEPGTLLYTGAITLSSTTTLRAVATGPGLIPSNVDTQTYLFLQDIFTQGDAPTGYPATWEGTTADYGIDTDIINKVDYQSELIAAFTDLPSLSLVTDLDNLFDASTGIYTHSEEDGIAWERPVSAELVHADGSEGFQADAGLRIHGGSSRIAANSPKHSFRLYFRSDYGPSRLDYDLFGNGVVTEFDTLVLRAGYNQSWVHNSGSQRSRALYARDEFIRQSQLAAGGEASQGTFVHLYLNGMYWGLYNVTERPDAEFAASHHGGEAEDYDARNHSGQIDGDSVAWDAMMALADAGLETALAYEQIQDYLDVESFADYMLTNIWAGNTDWPQKNWYATRLREPGAPFQFHSWDAENSLIIENENRVEEGSGHNPGGLYQSLRANEEYRVLMADRAQALFFGDGVLTPANQIARLQGITSQIQTAMIAESARWGDHRRATPYERNTEWQNELDRLVTSYLPQRTDIVIGQLRAAGLFPDTDHDAPSFSQEGGLIPPGSMLSITNNELSGAIYYTTDGSDPRMPGGGINPDAILYDGAFELPGEVLTIHARLLEAGLWSTKIAADFINGEPTPPQQYLRITELHYNPTGPSAAELAAGFTDGDQFEFIELLNTSATDTLDLDGVHFDTDNGGVAFAFGPGASLAPGQHGVLVSDDAAFAERYGPGVNVLGTYAANLSNGGEQFKLNDANGSTILDFTYEDGDDPGEEAWPTAPDGDGPSLTVLDTEGDYSDGSNWAMSGSTHGTPGAAESVVLVGDINDDGYVDGLDLDLILGFWGDTAASSATADAADLNDDGTVNGPDLSLLLANFGNGTPPGSQATSNGDTPDDPGGGADVGAGGGDDAGAGGDDAPEGDAPAGDDADEGGDDHGGDVEPGGGDISTDADRPPADPNPDARRPAPPADPAPDKPKPIDGLDHARNKRNTPDALALARPVTTPNTGEPKPGTEPPPPRRFDATNMRGK